MLTQLTIKRAKFVIRNSQSAIRRFWPLIKDLQTGLLLLTGVAGFLSAVHPAGRWPTLLGLAGSLFLAISGSTVLNMAYDADIDALMRRTCWRPLPRGLVTVRQAVILGVMLSAVGVGWALLLAPLYGGSGIGNLGGAGPELRHWGERLYTLDPPKGAWQLVGTPSVWDGPSFGLAAAIAWRRAERGLRGPRLAATGELGDGGQILAVKGFAEKLDALLDLPKAERPSLFLYPAGQPLTDQDRALLAEMAEQGIATRPVTHLDQLNPYWGAKPQAKENPMPSNPPLFASSLVLALGFVGAVAFYNRHQVEWPEPLPPASSQPAGEAARDAISTRDGISETQRDGLSTPAMEPIRGCWPSLSAAAEDAALDLAKDKLCDYFHAPQGERNTQITRNLGPDGEESRYLKTIRSTCRGGFPPNAYRIVRTAREGDSTCVWILPNQPPAGG